MKPVGLGYVTGAFYMRTPVVWDSLVDGAASERANKKLEDLRRFFRQLISL